MNKHYFLIGILFFLIVLVFVFDWEDFNEVCVNKTCFEVEIADTSEERQQGLMFRKEMSDESGMFFVFERNGFYPFWMKNTLIPLDIIWIDGARKIVYIAHEVQPCKKTICESYNPEREALYVLEINSGLSEKLGIEVGNDVELNF